MSLSQAVFLDFASIHPDDLDVSCLSDMSLDWRWRENTAEAETASAIAEAEVVITNKVVLGEQDLLQAKNLKLICAAATGVNNIDVVAAKKRGIVVCNVQAYATPAVVQHVFTLLLALTTRLEQYQQDVFNGNWSRSEFFCLLDYPIRELQGLTIGIVGYGELGRSVAKLALCFGMKVLIAKRNKEDVREGRLDLHDMLPRVDVLSLHCPLTADTYGLIARPELALMKADALLINTARGGLVDEAALLDALRENRLGGAGLDVLEREPPLADSPLMRNRPENLIITPHTAWASRESRQRLINEISKNIAAYQQGQPRNTV